jgi:hypothetical protein
MKDLERMMAAYDDFVRIGLLVPVIGKNGKPKKRNGEIVYKPAVETSEIRHLLDHPFLLNQLRSNPEWLQQWKADPAKFRTEFKAKCEAEEATGLTKPVSDQFPYRLESDPPYFLTNCHADVAFYSSTPDDRFAIWHFIPSNLTHRRGDKRTGWWIMAADDANDWGPTHSEALPSFEMAKDCLDRFLEESQIDRQGNPP